MLKPSRYHPTMVQTLDPADNEIKRWGVESVAKEDYKTIWFEHEQVLAAADQMAEAIKTKLNEDYRGNPPNEPGLRAALSNYLKVKESNQ